VRGNSAGFRRRHGQLEAYAGGRISNPVIAAGQVLAHGGKRLKWNDLSELY
jgi:hypothetical protein